MATRTKKQNAQTRNQKRKRKEEKRKKQKTRGAPKPAAVVLGRKHHQQIKSLVPVAWATENPLDAGLFDSSVFAELEPEEQQQLAPVKEALELVSAGRFEDAEASVSSLSRKSPMRDWRQLIRGLTHWYANDLDAAQKAWSRLDTSRRPARIALALQLAHRDDLAQLSSASSLAAEPIGSVLDAAVATPDLVSSDLLALEIDKKLLLSAKVVRRMRIERSAIKIARVGIGKKIHNAGDDPELTIVPEQLRWLAEFSSSYRSTEPGLVRALELAALERASNQPFVDIFEKAVKLIRGPVHDPRNNLRCYRFWENPSENSSKAESFLRRYNNVDLTASCTTLSEPLRNALRSSTQLAAAEAQIQANVMSYMPGIWSEDFYDDSDADRIRENFQGAIDAYPRNRKAYIAYTDWLEKEINDSDAGKQLIAELKTERVVAMKCWAEWLAEDAAPRLFLADALLEDEQLDEAAPHVDWLVMSRPDDPRVKALPWKLKLLQAMQLCRRVVNLPQVPAVLQEVKSSWPDWLSTRWLPYFTAAWMLRSGDHKNYEAQRESICSSSGIARNSLADACMMLAAAQKMKVAAADLKPLREPIETAVKNVRSLSDEALFEAGSFYWSLYQTKILYPAFRMHGSKFGREVLRRISLHRRLDSSRLTNPAFLDTMFWLSEHRFWSKAYELRIPMALNRLNGEHTYATAALTNALEKSRFVNFDQKMFEVIEFLKKSARTESNSFYRYWFNKLAEEMEVRGRKYQEVFGRNGRLEDLLDSFDLDDDCQCPACRAARQAEQTQKAHQQEPQAEEQYWQPELF